MDDIVTAARRVMRADRRMMELSGDELRAAITAFRAAGYAVVPREPTREMFDAEQARHGFDPLTDAAWARVGWTYRAMLAAAEAPKPEETT